VVGRIGRSGILLVAGTEPDGSAAVMPRPPRRAGAPAVR
jgi:hypothetical protein